MSRAITSKTATTSRGRGRGTNSSNIGRGSILNRGEKRDQQQVPSTKSTSNKFSGVGHSSYGSRPNRLNSTRGIPNNRGSTTAGRVCGRGDQQQELSKARSSKFPGVGQSSYDSSPNSLNSTRGIPKNRGSTTAGGRGRGATMYDDDDMSPSRQPGMRARPNYGQNNQNDQQQGSTNNKGTETNQGQDRTTHSGFTMVSPNEKKRRAITEQATKNLQEYERHKEERRIQHVSYVGTAGGGLLSEEEARRKAAIEHSKASFNSRTKRESYRAAEKENEEKVYRERKMAARRQSELNEMRQQKEEDRNKDEMRRKNAAFLDRLEANKPKPTSSANSNQDAEVSRCDVPVPSRSSGASLGTQNYVNNAANEDLNRLQIMFPDYTRNNLSELLQQMGSLELTIDILSE